MSGQGFASLSPLQKKALSAKGGKKAQASGRGYSFKGKNAKAKEASVKGVEARRRKYALRAAQRLMRAGLTPAQLASACLSVDEFIYYGGYDATKARFRELLKRIGDAENG